jgi:hypothetical protein
VPGKNQGYSVVVAEYISLDDVVGMAEEKFTVSWKSCFPIFLTTKSEFGR